MMTITLRMSILSRSLSARHVLVILAGESREHGPPCQCCHKRCQHLRNTCTYA